jgi:hypothetical protein
MQAAEAERKAREAEEKARESQARADEIAIKAREAEIKAKREKEAEERRLKIKPELKTVRAKGLVPEIVASTKALAPGQVEVPAALPESQTSLILISPNGGETLYSQDNVAISWTSTGIIKSVDIYYSNDGGNSYPESQKIGTFGPSESGILWSVPSQASKSVKIKIVSSDDPEVYDTSDVDFEITKGRLHLLSPNGGEVLIGGQAVTIKWEAQGHNIGNIKLERSKDNAADNYSNIIAIDMPAEEEAYAWKVPEMLGEEFKVKISALNDPTINDESDGVFSIKSGIALLRPQGNEEFIVGAQEEITWSTYGAFDKVNLYYSTDGGLTYPHIIVTDLSNIGTFSWDVPDNPGTQIKVRVEACADSSVISTSFDTFTIKR